MRPFLIGAVFTLATIPVLAQAPEGTPTRIRGTVEMLEGQILRVKTQAGQEIPVTLAPNFSISGVEKRSLSDIKPGDYIASTSVRGPDGKLRALEVHFCRPEPARDSSRDERHCRRGRSRPAGPDAAGDLQGPAGGNHRSA
jgi:hypothetical protein